MKALLLETVSRLETASEALVHAKQGDLAAFEQAMATVNSVCSKLDDECHDRGWCA